MTETTAKFFTTISDMRTVPAEKIDHFCEDLRLWLHMHKQLEEIQAQVGDAVKLKITTPTESFGWVDDGKHAARICIDLWTDREPRTEDSVREETK